MGEHNHTDEIISKPSAWANHPRAASLDAAEAAEAINQKIISNYQERINLSKKFASVVDPERTAHDAVVEAWEKTPMHDRLNLPTATRAKISSYLIDNDGGNRVRTEVFEQTFSEGSTNPAYARWQQAKAADFMDRLDKSAIIKNAEKNWDSPAFSISQKLALAQEIHNIQADVFGFKPATVKPFTEEPSPLLVRTGEPTNKKITKDGYFDSSENVLALNLYKDKEYSAAMHSSFLDFVDTVVHEGEHTFQNQLVDRLAIVRDVEQKVLMDLGVESAAELAPEGHEVYKAEWQRRIKIEAPDDPGNWNQELSGDGALAAHAEYMEHSSQYYMQDTDPGAGYKGYLSNPMEQKARDLGSIICGYFRIPPEERSNYIASERYDSHLNDVTEDKRLQKRAAATSKPDALAP